MLEKKGVSPVQCQTATSGGGGGSASGGATTGANSSQPSVADNSNGLEPNVLSQNRNSGSNGTNSASINNTNSGPNTPSDKMGAMATAQDFVIIKSEDQKMVSTNHCESKNKINSESNSIAQQLRTTCDSKLTLNTSNPNMCANRVAINSNNNNNNIKCRDQMMSCNAPNGPLNGICANTSSLDILNDEKLSSFPNELGMPVPTGNPTMQGDLPPLPLMSQSMNIMGSRGPCGPPPGQGPQLGMNVQPPNNVHHLVPNNNMSGQKSSVTMDSQYMQQQSQIFVFDTNTANRAAEAIDKGQYGSIVEFHCSNPETKRLLEKYPLKPQLNRNNSSAVWLNSLAQLKGGGRGGIKVNMNHPSPQMHPMMLNNSFGQTRSSAPVSCVVSCNMHNHPPGLSSCPGPGGGAPNNWSNNPNMSPGPIPSPNWSAPQRQMFAQNSEMNSNKKFSNTSMGPNGPNVRACGPPFAPNNFQNNPQMFNNSCNSSGVGVPPQLNGPEIPDENLTPQQRQHRETKLAIIRSMQQQLCPELMESSPMGHMIRMPCAPQSMNAPDYMMDRNNMCSNSMCSLPETEHLANSDQQINNNNTTQYSQSHSSMPPTPGTGPIDWQKSNYIDDRRRKTQPSGQGVNNNNNSNNNMCSVSNSVPISHASPLSQPSSALNSPSPCISQSPGSRIPPPPYNQGIRPHSSPHPHPSSPATSSLPLPSPRMHSPADPSRQQFTTGGQTRLPHTSPGPATPSADSNSSIPGTGHSPKPLPPSSQNSIPSSATSSAVVQNNCRTQTSTNVTNNMRATTPSNSIAPSSSPSNVKKLPKGMGQDCSELLMNQLPNSGLDNNRKFHSNDMSLLGPNGPNNCSSPFICKPEPALMPVPSPQQIQYLNAFEGQELTIQKQPNTSLRETDLISPAPDLDLGFGNEFGNSCQPFPGNERLNNFQIMDNMNPRFASNQQNPNMSGHQFELNPRFMNPDNNNQRFVGPGFEGPPPRMSNSHENQFRPQNMLCMPYGQMDNNMMSFNGPSCDNNMMAPRVRGPTDMVSARFAQHFNDNIQSPQHFNSSTMSPMSGEQQINLMSFGGASNQPSGTGCLVNNFNPQMESGVSSTHLQNLQKMTPPFDIGPPNKSDQMMMTNGPLMHGHTSNNQVMHGPNGPMVSVSQSQRTNTFDPISSMAAMGESNASNPMNAPNIMSGPSMNMSSMQVTANGPPPGPTNMVNFHTSMSSMQGIHQNISPDGNGMNGGMHGQYGMTQMNPNMTGGPQTVNNTYVNATMSIQQLNIQNGPPPTPNFNSNMDQTMNMGPQAMPGSGPGMSPPVGSMQMMATNNSAKLGSGFGHRMSGPTSGPNFCAQPMNNPRGMSPMNYQPNPQMMQRCSGYNSSNIQIKPEAPNTIQYLPPRQQNTNLSSRPPSLDFLQRCEPPLTNLGNKLPTHNLQYFPSNNTNMNSSQSMSLGPRMLAQNMPMASGPGRPINPSMVRAPNPNAGMVGAQQSMMSSGDMFGRPPGLSSMMNGPHMGHNGPNAMFNNMKQSGSGTMSPIGLPPEAAQSLPPSVGHTYNYQKVPFGPNMTPTSDPNDAIHFHNFKQQLYATNSNRSNALANANSAVNNPRLPSNNFYNSSK